MVGVWSLTGENIQWWPDMQFDAVRGAPLHETWAEDGVEHHATGHVVEVQDGTVFTFEWSEPSWPSPFFVRFELEQIGCGTRISVWECGFERIPSSNALRAAHHEGWKYHLARLCSFAGR